MQMRRDLLIPCTRTKVQSTDILSREYMRESGDVLANRENMSHIMINIEQQQARGPPSVNDNKVFLIIID